VPEEDTVIFNGGDSEMLASGFSSPAGHPSVSLPVGSHAGLPFGLQMTGRLGRDAERLSVARTSERVIAV